MGWRIDVEADDIVQFGGKLRVTRQLELPVAMGLQTMCLPDAADGAGADAAGLCHHVGRPVYRFARRISECQRDHPFNRVGTKRRNARRPGLPAFMNVVLCGKCFGCVRTTCTHQRILGSVSQIVCQQTALD